MINASETGLQVSGNSRILNKIINFLKKITWKSKSNYIALNNAQHTNNSKSNDFFNSLKYTEDPDKEILLKIQDELEKRGINKKNAFELTKDLSELQKQKLENLYIKQINEFKLSISNYKGKILKIRKQLNA